MHFNDLQIPQVETRLDDELAPAPSWTMAVHHEGENLFALYIAPFDPADLVSALSKHSDRLFSVSSKWGVQAVEPVTSPEGALRTAPLELVHVSQGAPRVDTALLASPHRAVDIEDPDAFGVSISDDDHAVVFSRDRELLNDVIRGYLSARIRETGLSDVDVPESATDRLTSPIEEAEWQEVTLVWHQGHPVLCTSQVSHGRVRTFQTRWLLFPSPV